MPLSNYALDTFVAPKLSELTICGAQELAQNPVSMGDAVLTLIFTSPFSDEAKKYVFNFVRRVSHSYYEYNQGRATLLEYINHPEVKGNEVSGILRSMAHFEQMFISSGIAIETIARFVVSNKSDTSKVALTESTNEIDKILIYLCVHLRRYTIR